MAENEFEKNVRQEMDEFKVHPSGEVWSKIEERIREKDRKRRILFFILFPAIALMLGGYGIYRFSYTNTTTQAQNATPGGDQPDDKNKTDNSKTEEHSKETIAIKPTIPTQTAKQTKNVLHANSKRQIVQSDKESIARTAVSKRNSVTQDQPLTNTTHPGRKENNPKADNANPQTTSTSSIDERPIMNNVDQTKTAKNENGRLIVADTASSKLQQSDDTRSVQVTNKKKADKVPGRISWGMNFSAGTSVITEEAFSFKSSAADTRNANSLGYYPGGGGPVPYTSYPQSQNKPAFAFKAGINARKNISKRSSLTAGLGYSYLADKIKIGAGQSGQLLSVFSFVYYSASPQQTYTDHFHFIELPLNYHWRVTNNADRFLSLSAGISPSWLIGTSTLIYDTTFGGVYFHNKDLVTKTHFNVNSGMAYQFTGRKNLEFAIGPQFTFDVTKIFKSDLDKRKYLLFTGIDARVFFAKKKK